MLLDQVSAYFRSMNLLYEGVPTRQGGHEVVATWWVLAVKRTFD